MLKGFIAAFAGLALAASAAFAEVPAKVGFVNDYANALTKDAGLALNDSLIAFDKETGVQVAVITVTSLNGADPEAYAKEVGTAWGVGSREKNDGVVFLISIKDRKTQIQVGPGSQLTRDMREKVIADFRTRARAGDVPGAIIAGTQEIMNDLRQPAAAPSSPAQPETVAAPERKSRGGHSLLLNMMIIGGLLLVGIIIYNSLDHDEREEPAEYTPPPVRQKEPAKDPEKDPGEAQRRSERLLAELPNRLIAAEARLAGGTATQAERERIERARADYTRAQEMHASKDSTMDWILLWMLLNSVNQNAYHAPQSSVAASDHSSHSPSSSSHSPSSSPSYDSSPSSSGGFGDSGGFGGGGFDSGSSGGGDGGGSGGSW